MMYLRSFCISGFSSQGFLYPGKIWRRTRKKVENRRQNQHDLEEFPLPDTLRMILSFSSCSGLALLMARVVERPHHERSRPNCHPTTLVDWRMSYVSIYTFLGHPTKDKLTFRSFLSLLGSCVRGHYSQIGFVRGNTDTTPRWHTVFPYVQVFFLVSIYLQYEREKANPEDKRGPFPVQLDSALKARSVKSSRVVLDIQYAPELPRRQGGGM